MKNNSLSNFVDQLPGLPILVAGDLILDEFIWGRVERISPEAPVPVVEITHESARLGGAANVAVNLASLGARPLLVGAVGVDEKGSRFLREMESVGLDSAGVLRDEGRSTTVKTRIIAHQQQVCRTDRESRGAGDPALPERLRAIFQARLSECNAVVISDYSKGTLQPWLVKEMLKLGRSAGRFVAVDPKAPDLSVYRGASVITPNKREAEHAAGFSITDGRGLREAALKIQKLAECEAVLITRGEEGMSLFEKGQQIDIPTVAREVFDVTGAGDTVIAVLALARAAGASIHEAALLANHAAGIVVAKIGTASASLEELRRSVADSDTAPSQIAQL